MVRGRGRGRGRGRVRVRMRVRVSVWVRVSERICTWPSQCPPSSSQAYP